MKQLEENYINIEDCFDENDKNLLNKITTKDQNDVSSTDLSFQSAPLEIGDLAIRNGNSKNGNKQTANVESGKSAGDQHIKAFGEDQQNNSHTSLGSFEGASENTDNKSSSTVYYDLMETYEHSKQISNKIQTNPNQDITSKKKAKLSKLDGIELDYSLLGKSPAKRGCTMKEPTTSLLQDKKKSKKRQRKLRDNKPLLNTLDLPVLSSTSKILSWDCTAVSTPMKNFDDSMMMADSSVVS